MPSFDLTRPMPVLPVYLASLSLMALVLITNLPHAPQLRGGFLSLFLLIALSSCVTALAVMLILQSSMTRALKVGLLLLQGGLLLPWATLVVTMLPILLFFGPGTCSKTFTSPSGTQTVTIETGCFMDCSNMLYCDDYIFQTELGGFYSTDKLCKPNHRVEVEWSADETVTHWTINGTKQSIRVR